MQLERDENGKAHIVALSGGKDSTALALRLKELNPDTPYSYVCTPTGDELPDMIGHWKRLSEKLEKPILPVTGGVSLNSLIKRFNALPNSRMRWCTRMLKIEPFKAFLLRNLPAVIYVGLRADEQEREGAVYGEIEGIEQRFPMREWEWSIGDVFNYLDSQGIKVPRRTDCARCYAQQLGEWWNLWADHPDKFEAAVIQEESIGHTFRSASRDSWPASLKEMRERFENGEVPSRSKSTRHQLRLFDELDREDGRCRVCTM